jgi:predicted GIY-YIG superfamily endonuclease
MRLPVKLVYVEEQPDRRSAMKREIAIKKMQRAHKLKLIEGKRVHK